jgi:cytochrome c-type biogenesis protein
MVWFGAAYAVCSLGCTLPIFVALVGPSLATASVMKGAIVFGAYAFRMATILVALSLGAALARDGLGCRVNWFMRQAAFSSDPTVTAWSD